VALAGQKPTTPLAVNHLFSQDLRQHFLRVLEQAVAASPTISSSRMAGYLPASSQVAKNGVQSIWSARS
jgi:peroxiredoxin